MEYYQKHSSGSGTAPSDIADLYASHVTWYKNTQLTPSEIVQKKLNEVFNKWPTRSFSVRESSLNYNCDPIARSCSVSGTVDFSFVSSAGNVLNNHALFEFEFSDLTGRPKISSEWPPRSSEVRTMLLDFSPALELS